MIAQTLRRDVERYADEARASNVLMHRASTGAMTRAEVARYLASMRQMLQNNFGHIDHARRNAEARGQSAVAAYFAAKLQEEIGHDLWAEQGLSRLGEGDSVGDRDVVPVLQELKGYLTTVIDRDPTLFIAYSLFAEYLTVLLGSEFVSMAVSCGIPEDALTVVSNHVVLDEAHVEDALIEVDELAADPRLHEPLRDVLANAFGYFQRFCAEVCDPTLRAHAV